MPPLRFILKSGDVAERELHAYLQALLYIGQIWEPNHNVVAVLWNYFFKRLNSSFLDLSTGTLIGLQSKRFTFQNSFIMGNKWERVDNLPVMSLSGGPQEIGFSMWRTYVVTLMHHSGSPILNFSSGSWVSLSPFMNEFFFVQCSCCISLSAILIYGAEK